MVVAVGAPFKIDSLIILLVFVDMINAWIVVRVWNERGRDESMHKVVCLLALFRKRHLQVSVAITR